MNQQPLAQRSQINQRDTNSLIDTKKKYRRMTKDENDDNGKEKNHKDFNNTSIAKYILQRSAEDAV